MLQDILNGLESQLGKSVFVKPSRLASCGLFTKKKIHDLIEAKKLSALVVDGFVAIPKKDVLRLISENFSEAA